MQNPLLIYVIPFAILLCGALSFYLKKTDALGTITGLLLAFILWAGSGLESLLTLLLFFLTGTAATSWKKHVKSMEGLAQERKGQRGILNVLSNGGIPLLLAILAIVYPKHQYILSTMIASGFAVACSDTLSSELGNVYGKHHFNILNFKPAQKGKDGVVSLFGFGVGVAGSSIITLSTYLYIPDLHRIIIILVCGFLGNIVDSILGATLQNKGYINNHQVNFLATLSGALLCLFLL